MAFAIHQHELPLAIYFTYGNAYVSMLLYDSFFDVSRKCILIFCFYNCRIFFPVALRVNKILQLALPTFPE